MKQAVMETSRAELPEEKARAGGKTADEEGAKQWLG